MTDLLKTEITQYQIRTTFKLIMYILNYILIILNSISVSLEKYNISNEDGFSTLKMNLSLGNYMYLILNFLDYVENTCIFLNIH